MATAGRARPQGGHGRARPEGRRDHELETLEELKARVDIVDIARGYCSLKRQGPALWARCPLHSDKTPSFKVAPVWQRFHCFGCDAQGDVFDLVGAAERLSVADAIIKVRAMAGGRAAPDLAV